MVTTIKQRLLFSLFIITLFFLSSVPFNVAFPRADTPYSIELKQFRWNQFPLKVLVMMNQWSKYDYAVSVREALDNWVTSIWNYTRSFSNTTLLVTYLFYVSSINYTSNSDIIISFVQDLISLEPETIGITTYSWDSRTNTPNPPIMIEITTHSATADCLFVKTVAMHELGHAMGLGHASSPNTMNGPEIMYPSLLMNQIIYPSTLDIYGLTMLYQDHFGEIVHLPANIPYQMIAEAQSPLYPALSEHPINFLYPAIDKLQYILTNRLNIITQPIILLIPCTIWLIIALFFGLIFRSSTGATFTTTIFSFILAYFCSLFYKDFNLSSLGLKIITILPGIMIGAFIGGYVGNRFAGKRETFEDNTFAYAG